MEIENLNCKKCLKTFTLDQDDNLFYQKIKVPPPTLCPVCRRQRRMSWRNDFTFYNRECGMCGKNIISLYHKDKPLTVYCNKCWWSDKWDPKDFAKDFDFSRPFFEQFRELQEKVPILALMNDDGIGSVNSQYTQNEAYARNCYMVSMAWKNENCMYSYGISGPNAVDVVDSMDIFASEKIYESVFLNKCYDCKFCFYSYNLVSSGFCYDCRNCTDCFMCFGIENGQYMFKNVKYSREEYEEIVKSYELNTFGGQNRAIKEFEIFLLNNKIKKDFLINCVDCSGDSLLDSKNAKFCYTARRLHNVKYFENGNDIKDGYDMLVGGENELCYEGITPDNDRMALFTIFSYKCSDISYCEHCFGSQDLFGCSGLRQAQYCILNKQYSKEDYLELRDKIIQHMKDTGEYGEFFPSEMSHFGYNETIALDNFPKNKDEALSEGFTWFDDVQFTIGKENLLSSEIPEDINEVSDDIVNKILACDETNRNYIITESELNFYRKMQVPIPRKCFFVRHKHRIEKRHPRPFY